MAHSISHSRIEHLTRLRVPFIFSAAAGGIRWRPPRLGEHTEELLVEILGCSLEEASKLQQAGVI